MPHELSPKEQVVLGWLTKALNDLETAELALDRPRPIVDTGCFHRQQVVEKGLKALLVLHEHEPPRTHSLDVLFDSAVRFAPRLSTHRIACDALTAYAVEPRYPDTPDPTIEKALAARDAAKSFFSSVLELVPEHVRPRRTAGPGAT
jgi:HEPN domain-containing protein